jgi:hypothetical protein
VPTTRTAKARKLQAIGDATHPDLSDPKELDTNVMYHNSKRKHGMDINNQVYQVPVSSAYRRNYDLIRWDK